MTDDLMLGLSAVLLAVTGDRPRVLTLGKPDAIPFGRLDLTEDPTLELGMRRLIRGQTGIDVGYVEQLYTFGDRLRDPREAAGGPRVISVAYLALVREGHVPDAAEAAQWRDCYAFFPWEDRRGGRPEIIADAILPGLEAWIAVADQPETRRRRERADIAFGIGVTAWDPERVLERYELLYEVGLVAEAHRDAELHADQQARSALVVDPDQVVGRVMALDHRRILATALGRLRGKIKYRPVIFELVPRTFTLLQLQRVVEALSGIRLHKGNFRRLVERGGLVEGTGQRHAGTGGRPAELFRFRREVLRERRAPGVGLPKG